MCTSNVGVRRVQLCKHLTDLFQDMRSTKQIEIVSVEDSATGEDKRTLRLPSSSNMPQRYTEDNNSSLLEKKRDE